MVATVAAMGAGSRAGVVDMLGEQDFADGYSFASSAEAANAGIGEVYPFDGTMFRHDDRPGTFGAIEYTHIFDPSTLGDSSVILTLGLFDHDSFPGTPPLDTVDLFFDGVPQPTDMFLGVSIPDASASIVAIDVPQTYLADGELTVRVETTIPGREGNSGNSIFADFSSLATVPEPATLLLMCLGGAAVLRRRAARPS